MKRLVALFVFLWAGAVTLAQTAPVTNPPDGAQPMEQASTAGNFGNLTIAPGGLQDWCCSNLGYVNPATGASTRNYGHFSVGIQTTLSSSGFVATWQIFGQNGGMSCGKGDGKEMSCGKGDGKGMSCCGGDKKMSCGEGRDKDMKCCGEGMACNKPKTPEKPPEPKK